MILALLLLSWLLWPIARTQFNLYNTDETLDIDRLQVNCLHYYNSYDWTISEKIEYCLGPTDSNNSSIDEFLNIRDRNFTFDELRQLNVTTKELLSWSATIDLAERYQYYIDQEENSSASREVFFNCTKPWFGSRCQYSFGLGKMYWFQDIVQRVWSKKFAYKSPYSITNLTCYIDLTCDRGGSDMCLDWREVCDGRIDCVDGGADEAECFDLEVNECDENEYRCHNGLCIPNEFLEDKTAQCLDTSDISGIFNLASSVRNPDLFHYEEYSCRTGYTQFACGDGECVADFDICRNKRHLLLTESISVQGNLLYTCWMAMVCLTKILDQVNGTACDQFLRSSDINGYLQTCEDLTQFPTVPVLFGHVRFLYRLKDARDLHINLSLTPDYVCYDQQLCDFLTPTFLNGNYSCRYGNEIGFDSNMKLHNWTSVIRLVESYFRKCLTRPNNTNDFHHPSLYCCKNSSKCISKHRILDNISDCYLNDDEEEFEISCLIRDTLRFKCPNGNKCYSALFSREICPPSRLSNFFNEILFQQICDRHVQMFPVMINGKNYTDETECEHWPCSNIYTRCDGFWSCPYGEDEENCTTGQICDSRSLACVSPDNYTLTCLSAERVGDGVIDCLGAADELQHCRSDIFYHRAYHGFHCLNDSKCVGTTELCNRRLDCPLEDDETFCGDHHKICDEWETPDRTDVEETLCRIGVLRKIQFSLETSPVYPLYESRTIERIAHRSIERRSIPNPITNEPDDPKWPWRCNHGLYVRLWLGGNNFSYRCFCPPSYYGDICQYQNQRVSFTAIVKVVNIHDIYSIIVTLIDDDDNRQEINSYYQFSSVIGDNCERNFNVFLTYSTQPKNISKNYSVRVDVFNTTCLTYVASWHYRIPFPFLPVNRMAIILNIPAQRVLSSVNCPWTCHNGECMKYVNEDKLFCRCDTGWSGVRCDIPIRCSDCSPGSICIGMIHNRSICVCPPNKGGLRCLLTLVCPEDLCANNGQCLVVDDGMNHRGYACICPEQFDGTLCQISKRKLEISFHNIKVSSFLLIYIFYSLADVTGFEQMALRVIPKKLTMFQRTVSLYSVESLEMVFVKTDDSYYLAALQQFNNFNISTSIDSDQRCVSINELLNSQLVGLPEIRRVKYYHVICQTHFHLMCFSDESYMCLCTLERHANCFRFEGTPPRCPHNIHCENGAECLQDDIRCPRATMCNCTDCFFGDRCLFYAKGIGLTLDDILRYEIRPNTPMHDQTVLLKWSSAFTIIMFVAGLINSVLSILTFCSKVSREVGCGIYLLASSITSLLTVSIFTFKFWFFVFTQINPSISRTVLRGGCISLEFILKVCLYMDNWLNTCVALERSMTVYKGINFNKMLSRRIAQWVLLILPFLIVASMIHEPVYRKLVDDDEEQRPWCVFHYSPSIHNYNTTILFFHFLGPFCANLFSALFIIFSGARRRAATQKRHSYNAHLRRQFKEHKSLIISPIILVILSLPRLIISFFSGCVKASRNSWLYLSGYFVSFIPSVAIFIVFVLPSNFYRKQFQETIKSSRR